MEVEYLTLEEILDLHAMVIERAGGTHGVRDEAAIQSVLEQMAGGFGDCEFYPSLPEKAAFLGFSLLQNHLFLDGNKRTAFLAMETFLMFNGCEFAPVAVDDQERFMLDAAAGKVSRGTFFGWVAEHVRPMDEAVD